MSLFELIFHVKKGIFCPECGEQITYEDAFKDIEERTLKKAEEIKTKVQEQYRTE